MAAGDVATLAAVGSVNLVTYWFVVIASLPGLRLRESAVVKQSATAVANTVPAGGAVAVGVTFTMLTSWGFPVAAVARSVIVTGIWNNFVRLALPLATVVVLALGGVITPARVAAASLGIAFLIGGFTVIALLLRSDRLARSMGNAAAVTANAARRALGRKQVAGWDEDAARFRADTTDLLSARWAPLTLWTVASHASLYAVLLASLRAVGVSANELGWITVLASFAFVRLISALPITPGGLGVVELGYAASLTIGADPATRAGVVAAVLVFRAITYVFPTVLGLGTLIGWQLTSSADEGPPEDAVRDGSVDSDQREVPRR
jgi:uncharacterized protein (TIRG00374 family)